MTINVPVLMMWVQVVAGVSGFGFLAAWALTGRKNSFLRIMGGVSILIMCGAMLYKMMNGPQY